MPTQYCCVSRKCCKVSTDSVQIGCSILLCVIRSQQCRDPQLYGILQSVGGFFQTEFRSSDRQQYSARSGNNFARGSHIYQVMGEGVWVTTGYLYHCIKHSPVPCKNGMWEPL